MPSQPTRREERIRRHRRAIRFHPFPRPAAHRPIFAAPQRAAPSARRPVLRYFPELRQLKSRRSMPGLDTSRVNFPGTKSSTSRSAPRRRLTASHLDADAIGPIDKHASRGWRPGFMSSMPQSRHLSATIAGENRVFKASTPKRLLVLCSARLPACSRNKKWAQGPFP